MARRPRGGRPGALARASVVLMAVSVAAALLLLAGCADATTTTAGIRVSCHGHDFPRGTYGEPTSSSSDGASAFAPLTGVACGGRCYYEALAWQGTVGPNKNISSPQECLDLCVGLGKERCDVWQYHAAEQKCSFKRSVAHRPGAHPTFHAPPNTSDLAGPRTCDTRWLPELEGLGQVDPAGGRCLAAGKSAGEGTASCSTLEVAGPGGVVALGSSQGWWPESVGQSASAASVETCQSSCEDRAGCDAFSFVDLGNPGGPGVCVLRGRNGTAAPDGSAACPLTDNPAAVSGLVGDCTGSSAEPVDPWFADCSSPRCTRPYTSNGTFVDGGTVFRPLDGGCHYHISSPQEMLECLNGRWFLLSGGSNAILTYMNWVNAISPGTLHPQRDGLRTYYVDLVDVVFDVKLRKVVHLRTKLWRDDLGVQDGFQGQITEEMRAKLVGVWNEAPFYTDEGGVESATGLARLSLVVGQYWQNTGEAFKAMEEVSGPWRVAERALFAQIMIWYLVCGVWNIYFCTNYSYYGLGHDLTVAVYSRDLKDFLDSSAERCERALGCFFAPHIFQPDLGWQDQLTQHRMREEVKAQLASRNSSKLHFLDAHHMGLQKLSETVDNHWTGFMHSWLIHVILSGVCDAGSSQLGCPHRVAFSKGCLAETLADANCKECQCPLYQELCKTQSDGCKDWECMNSRTCQAAAFVVEEGARLGAGEAEVPACVPKIRVKTSHPDATATASGGVAKELAPVLALAAVALAAVALLWDPRARSQLKAALAALRARGGGRDESVETGQGAAPKTDQRSDLGAGKGSYLPALGMARLLASVHIVVGHLHAEGALRDDSVYAFRYGFTWVPWFFMLSGFVLTHARLSSPDPNATDPPGRFIVKRLASVYPMYALGLMLVAVTRAADGRSLPESWILTIQAWLLQSFVPNATEKALQAHCWFLSALMLYWVLFRPLYTRGVLKMGARACLLALLILSLVPHVASFALPAALGEPFDWYAGHRYGNFDDGNDALVVLVKFHPLCYLHVFVFGMVLARARDLVVRAEVKEWDIWTGVMDGRWEPAKWVWVICRRWLALAGYLGLGLVMCLPDLQPPGHKISARLSVLLPLQGLVLLGLSMREEDLVARAFALAPRFCGDASYAQYVLQFWVHDVWPWRTVSGPSFFVFLFGLAIVAFKAVQEPCRRFLCRHADRIAGLFPWSLFLPAPVLAVLLAAWALASPSNEGAYVFLPRYVKSIQGGGLGTARVDVFLGWTFADTPGPPDYLVRQWHGAKLINPSLAMVGGSLEVAGRIHRLRVARTNVEWEGKRVTEIRTTWESMMLVGDRTDRYRWPADDSSWFGWDTDDTWHPFDRQDGKVKLLSELHAPMVSNSTEPCAYADGWGKGEGECFDALVQPAVVFIAENNTLLRKVVTGAEDPKVLAFRPPGATQAEEYPLVAFNSLPPSNLAPGSAASGVGGHSQMFLYRPLDKGVNHAVRLKCGQSAGDEKNWIAFRHQTAGLLFVYSVYPHVVVQARDEDGSCIRRWSTNHAPLLLASIEAKAEIHGSGTATFVPSSRSKHEGGHFIALLHFVTKGGVYTTMAYEFAAAPPFGVLRVSRPLPLLSHTRAFASGLMLLPDKEKVVVTYGVQNEESRLLIMAMGDFENLFECDG